MRPRYVRGDIYMERRTCVHCNREQKFPPNYESAKETDRKEKGGEKWDGNERKQGELEGREPQTSIHSKMR